jgi:hypothetical protein
MRTGILASLREGIVPYVCMPTAVCAVVRDLYRVYCFNSLIGKSVCCCLVAVGTAKTHTDDSECLFNCCCFGPVPTRWLIRTAQGIKGDSYSDCAVGTFCPCCTVNQMLQTSVQRGNPFPNAGREANTKPWNTSVPSSLYSNGFSGCFETLGTFIFALLCLPCSTGSLMEESVGMPCCLACLCVNPFAARNLVRYQYRVEGMDVQEECCYPSCILGAAAGIGVWLSNPYVSAALCLPYLAYVATGSSVESKSRVGATKRFSLTNNFRGHPYVPIGYMNDEDLLKDTSSINDGDDENSPLLDDADINHYLSPYQSYQQPNVSGKDSSYTTSVPPPVTQQPQQSRNESPEHKRRQKSPPNQVETESEQIDNKSLPKLQLPRTSPPGSNHSSDSNSNSSSSKSSRSSSEYEIVDGRFSARDDPNWVTISPPDNGVLVDFDGVATTTISPPITASGAVRQQPVADESSEQSRPGPWTDSKKMMGSPPASAVTRRADIKPGDSPLVSAPLLHALMASASGSNDSDEEADSDTHTMEHIYRRPSGAGSSGKQSAKQIQPSPSSDCDDSDVEHDTDPRSSVLNSLNTVDHHVRQKQQQFQQDPSASSAGTPDIGARVRSWAENSGLSAFWQAPAVHRTPGLMGTAASSSNSGAITGRSRRNSDASDDGAVDNLNDNSSQVSAASAASSVASSAASAMLSGFGLEALAATVFTGSFTSDQSRQRLTLNNESAETRRLFAGLESEDAEPTNTKYVGSKQTSPRSNHARQQQQQQNSSSSGGSKGTSDGGYGGTYAESRRQAIREAKAAAEARKASVQQPTKPRK